MKILFAIGTRPEAIKLSPIIHQFKRNTHFKVTVLATGQHTDLLTRVNTSLNIDFDLFLQPTIRSDNLVNSSARLMDRLNEVLIASPPEWIIVHGDTQSAFITSLCGFLNKIKVVHIEAGLRSHHLYSPFPEEGFRCLISKIASLHFPCSEQAYTNLENESVAKKKLYKISNPLYDALNTALAMSNNTFEEWIQSGSYRYILVTVHRREKEKDTLLIICEALLEIVMTDSTIRIIFVVHPNPKIKSIVQEKLSCNRQIMLKESQDYVSMIQLIQKAELILTDSGGIQEEASYLNIPTLILRQVTERQDGVIQGTAKLIRITKEQIVSEARAILANKKATVTPLASQSSPQQSNSYTTIAEAMVNF